MSVAVVAAGGPTGSVLSVSCFTVSMDDSLHCVKAASADPDCLRSIFDYRMGMSISGYRIQNSISGYQLTTLLNNDIKLHFIIKHFNMTQ